MPPILSVGEGESRLPLHARALPAWGGGALMARVLVAMSGGVDSSVTALLLQRAGHECVGVTMRLYDGIRIDCKQPTRCSLEDTEDAHAVATSLGMPFHVLDYRQAFDEKVIAPFVDEYARGRTPNPCLLCNRHLKFGLLLEAAGQLGCDFIATGHYAQVERDADGICHVRCGLDPKKDQGYVLYALQQDQLQRLLLPLGGLDKREVRALAEEAGLPVASKRESQDICFVPDGDYAGFLAHEGVVDRPGDFVDGAGRVLGRHRGIAHYTIGQRKGLGLAVGHPVYVTAIDAQANTIAVGPREALAVDSFTVDDVRFTAPVAPCEPFEADVRTHYHAPRIPVRVHPEGTRATVEALGALGAVAPGQAAVFYRGDEVLGGGTIC
jgi:tRNA-specific 2-thiouridylase